ncbi:hypothetical protein PR003_g19902 [Phytophthora rubi]|uniref:Uncharacterized protein n=1 Tax=Phytophthora rubi TaxID=129364 RepID=A0A6A3K768_9STRA|nr:hypothetical protein PR001_g18757 [Phytophthora rubi]KAE9311903.1 hypothetical protein PR003_g19902 [Phytophthora rubi]
MEPSPIPASSHSGTTPAPVQNLREEVTTLYEQRQSGDGRAKQRRWRVLQLLSAMKSGLRDKFLETDARRGQLQVLNGQDCGHLQPVSEQLDMLSKCDTVVGGNKPAIPSTCCRLATTRRSGLQLCPNRVTA